MKTYRYIRNDGCINLDSNGYILESKGFGQLLWSLTTNDNDLIGKHIDELAEMLKKHGANENVYLRFETEVHLPFLKDILKDKSKSNTFYGIYTTDDERSGSIKEYCSTREIAVRELKHHYDWFCSHPPKADDEHIIELKMITE